jgi:hypothetical protein
MSEFWDALKDGLSKAKKIDQTNFAVSSQKVFLNNFLKIYHQQGGLEKYPPDMNFLKNYAHVQTTITDKYPNIKTQLNMYNAIIIVMDTMKYPDKAVRDNFHVKRENLKSATMKERLETGGMTKQQKKVEEKGLDATRILEIAEKMRYDVYDRYGDLGTRKLAMAYMVIMIHSEFSFRNDLAGLMIVNDLAQADNKEVNYLVIDGDNLTFVMNNYKTSKRYGRRDMVVKNSKVKKAIVDYYDNYIKDSSTEKGYLLSWKKTGNPLSANDLTQLLRDTFKEKQYGGEPISTTNLAKIFDETARENIMEADISATQKVIDQAAQRGHSVKTRLDTYSGAGTKPVSEATLLEWEGDEEDPDRIATLMVDNTSYLADMTGEVMTMLMEDVGKWNIDTENPVITWVSRKVAVAEKKKRKLAEGPIRPDPPPAEDYIKEGEVRPLNKVFRKKEFDFRFYVVRYNNIFYFIDYAEYDSDVLAILTDTELYKRTGDSSSVKIEKWVGKWGRKMWDSVKEDYEDEVGKDDDDFPELKWADTREQDRSYEVPPEVAEIVFKAAEEGRHVLEDPEKIKAEEEEEREKQMVLKRDYKDIIFEGVKYKVEKKSDTVIDTRFFRGIYKDIKTNEWIHKEIGVWDGEKIVWRSRDAGQKARKLHSEQPSVKKIREAMEAAEKVSAIEAAVIDMEKRKIDEAKFEKALEELKRINGGFGFKDIPLSVRKDLALVHGRGTYKVLKDSIGYLGPDTGDITDDPEDEKYNSERLLILYFSNADAYEHDQYRLSISGYDDDEFDYEFIIDSVGYVRHNVPVADKIRIIGRVKDYDKNAPNKTELKIEWRNDIWEAQGSGHVKKQRSLVNQIILYNSLREKDPKMTVPPYDLIGDW